MRESNVVGSSPMNTPARGAVGAVLSGNRLIVRGSFKMLSSDMRDYASDPVNPPNSNITSAFHIHQGSSMENGPFQYALNVMLDDTGHGGSAMGEFTLTPEQMQALADNRLYVDIHTTKNRGGELRGTLMPY
ncbi:CHRD domain-containing protein [cf. Phormidesmis sp. LEGE 11477]|uniref:CHRD domain-containing protein n=1 Tax=cf. Phormidesmis sp. LEGE 11477 TaxID=1828680 RepID=UPI001D15D192|nr:CHRD domain-containing protein [cf. Phormidesmis sp. LEGE 11477]